jgi:hypothetical protein
MKISMRSKVALYVMIGLFAGAQFAHAGGHTWRIKELFSNADGTIQYVEVWEAFGGAGETATSGHAVTSNTKSFVIPPPNVTGPTTFRSLLIATPAFAALPGAPTPDYVLPLSSVPFFSTTGDTILYTGLDTFTFGAGILPTDGVHALRRSDSAIVCNSPANYAQVEGFVNVDCDMQGDVDGSGAVDGGDVSAFLRVVLGNPDVGDNAACAEYCEATLAASIVAFVDDLLG